MRLNASSVRTTQSCEGHLDHGFPYPWVRIVEQDCALLESLLETFYEHRAVVYDRMLSIEHILTDEYMLRSHGGILQKSRDLDERAEKIKEYQQEMQSFAEFIKERF